MKVLVIGAAGRTGKAVVERAIAAGHQVTAFARDAGELDMPGVRVVKGDATDQTAVEAATRGQDAVLDTVGGTTPYKQTTLETSVAKTVITAMERNGVRRLVATSMLGVGESRANATFYERLLVSTLLRGADKDKSAMEAEIKASALEWVILRPAILTDDPASGRVHVYSEDDGEKAHQISRADLAAFIVDQLSSNEHLRRSITIAGS